MKLILSRKGFDSAAGGCPNPILPDGRMIVLPIPDRNSVISYSDIQCNGHPIGPMVEQLTDGRIPQRYRAHLDPDLAEASLPRRSGWRPIFGQSDQAQSHLRNNNVGPGDVFLFFGLFRPTKATNGTLRWDRRARPRHVIWGWLQVDEVLSPNDLDPADYAWAQTHPHFHRGDDPYNTIYVGRNRLSFNGDVKCDVPGAGVFPKFLPELQLTAADSDRLTDWDLPDWFFPASGRVPLTYHGDPERWQRVNGRSRLRTVGRGQEFVLDCEQYPEASCWVRGLLDMRPARIQTT